MAETKKDNKTDKYEEVPPKTEEELDAEADAEVVRILKHRDAMLSVSPPPPPQPPMLPQDPKIVRPKPRPGEIIKGSFRIDAKGFHWT